MNPSQSGPRVQRGFEPESAGFVPPREQTPYLAALFRYTSAMNALDFDTVTELFDPGLVHMTLPSSLQRPVVNYDQYFKYLDSVTDMFLEFSVTVLEIVEKDNKMTVQLNSMGRGRSQRPYFNEIVLLIQFSKPTEREERKHGSDGTRWPPHALPKMVNVKEYVDSLSSRAWFKEERQWMKDNGDIVAQQNADGEIRWRKTKWRQRQSMQQQSPTLPQGMVPGQPTQFNPSPTMGPGYQHAYPPAFPPGGGFSGRPSQGYGQEYISPTSASSSSRGYSMSTSLGSSAQGRSYSHSKSSQGYPGSYHPHSRDRYDGT